MAQNVVIDIDASTKSFEGALDDLTKKVRSTADQIDKAFSFSGADKSIKATSTAVSDLGNGLKDIGMIAAGNILADSFEKAFRKVKSFGQEIYVTTSRMQSLEMGMKSLVTSDLVKTGQVADYTEATQKAEAETQKLMGWFKELSLKSPYELMEVMEAFKQNANMGQSVAIAKKTTEAILALGAGLGMGQAEMKRFSAALAQTGATGRITAMDLRQFANNGFGMDKMNQIFGILSEKFKIVIADNNDFNKAVAEGKITTDDFFEALNSFALSNYGNAIDAMASTIEGLKSSLGDIKVSAINDLFLETTKTLSKTVAPYIEYLMQLLTGGDFKEWGNNINEWAKGFLGPLQKIGETLQNGLLTAAMNTLKDFFSGKTVDLGWVKVFLNELGGAEFADKLISKILVIKNLFDKFLAHKDLFIDAIKGIGIALAAAFAVNKLTTFLSILTSLNNPITKLSVIGAALGVAWNRDLFKIQERVQHLKNYLVNLYDIFKKDGWSGVWNKLSASAVKAWTNIKKTWNGNKFLSKIPLDKLVDAFKFGKAIMEPMVAPFRQAFDNAISYATNLFQIFRKDGISAVFEKIGSDIKSKALGIIETITGYIEKYTNAYKTGGFGGLLEALLPDVKGQFSEFWNHFSDGLQARIPIIKAIFSKIFGPEITASIENGFNNVINWIVTAFNDVKNAITNAISYAKEIKEIFNKDGLSGVFQKVKDDIAGILPENVLKVLQTIWTWIERIAKSIGGLALGIGSLKLLSFVSEMPTVLATIGEVITGVGGILSTVIASIGGWPVIIVAALMAIGFAIVGQFVDFGQLISNVFTTIKNTIVNVFSDIKAKVSEKISGLKETLEPFWEILKAIGGLAAIAGGAIATVVIGLGTLVAGAINGLIKGIDEIIGAIISGVDFVFSLVRLPFDLIINLITFIVGVVTGNGELISNSVSNIVDRISHTWNSFKEFFVDLWGFLEDYFSGIWDVIVAVADATPIEDKFREIRDTILGYIQELENRWNHFWNRLTGNTVEMNGVEISGKTKDAWDQYKEKLESDEYYIATRAMDQAEFGLYYGKGHEETKQIYEQYSDEALFEKFFEKLDWDISYLFENYNADLAKWFLDKEYGEGFSEDPYIQSLIDNACAELGINTGALDANTESTEENTEKSGGDGGKVPGGVPFPEVQTQIELTEIQNNLLKTATNTLEHEFKEAIVKNKSYYADSIENLGKIISTAEGRTKESLLKSIDAQIDAIGLEKESRDAIMSALESAADEEQLLAMLGTIYDALVSGNSDLVAELQAKGTPTVVSGQDIDQILEDVLSENGKKEEKQESLLSKWWNEIKSTLGFGKEFKFELPEVKFDPNTTQAVLDAYESLKKYVDNQLSKDIANMKESFGEEGMPRILEYSLKEMMMYLDKKDTDTFKKNPELFRDSMLSAIKHSGLPDDIQNAFITAMSVDGISNDTIATYVGFLIQAIEEAGIMAASGKAEGGEEGGSTYANNWNGVFTKAMSDEYGKYLASHETEILQEMGLSAYEAYLYANSKKKEDVEAYTALRGDAIEKLGLTMEKWYEAETHTGQSQYSEIYMSNFLKNFEASMGTTFDGIRDVTAENFTEARDFLTSLDTWETFAETVHFGGEGITEEYIMTGLKDMLKSVGYSQSQISDTMENLEFTMTNMDSEQRLSWLKFLISGVNGTIEDFATANDKDLQAVNSSITGKSGDTGNALVRNFDDLITKYNNATGTEKDLLGYELQAMLDASWIGGKEGGYSGNMGEGRLLLTDLMNGEVNNETYLAAKHALSNNQYSEAIFDAMVASYTKSYLEAIEKGAITDQKYQHLFDNLDLSDTDKDKTPKDKGMLGFLFGEDFDLSELGSQLFSGIFDSLDADTVANLKELLGIDIPENAGKNWRELGTGMSVLGQAMKSISESVGDGGQAVFDLLRRVSRMAQIEISEDVVAGWTSFAGALSTLGDALQKIMGALGVSVNVIGDMSGVDANAIAPEGMFGVLGNLEKLAQLEIGENVIASWQTLGAALGEVAAALTTIDSFMRLLTGTGLKPTTPEGTEGTTPEGSTGLMGMLFGNMDVESLAILAQVLTPELFSSIQTLIKTPIDSGITDSWTAFGTALKVASDAIVAMMVALTGGEEGELGEEETGGLLAEGLTKLGDTAQNITPQFQNFLNPELSEMQTHFEQILAALSKIIDIWAGGEWKKAVDAYTPLAEQATGVTQELASKAQAAANAYSDWAGAIWEVIHALEKLNSMTEGKKSPKAGSSGDNRVDLQFAGGTHGFRYGTAIVGEHGPELITTGSTALNVFANTQLMSEIANARHALNSLSSGAESFAYNRMMGGMASTYRDDHSQNFNAQFGTVVGDDAFESMLEDKMRNFWRREMRLAN